MRIVVETVAWAPLDREGLNEKIQFRSALELVLCCPLLSFLWSDVQKLLPCAADLQGGAQVCAPDAEELGIE